MASNALKQSAQPRAPFIEQLLGSGKGRLFDLPREIMSIGRAPDNDIVINSEAVSRCHAFLKKTAKGWLLQDNQSKNGVKRNGEKVVETPLNNADVVQIGDFVFRFNDPSQPNVGPNRLKIKNRPLKAQPPPSYENALTEDWNTASKLPAGSSIQFAVIIAALIVVSVLIGFRLRHQVSNWTAEIRTLAKPATNVTTERDKTLRGVSAGNSTLSTPNNSEIAPIDQNNPNEGRVVEETVIATPAAENTAPPPPPIAPEFLSKKDLQIHSSKKAAGRTITKDLGVYLQEGRDYLKEGDFESAALAFRFALVIDPNNRTAIEGIRAAEFRRRDLPTEASAIEPAVDRKTQVRTLIKTAREALNRRNYQEAINTAEKARHIEIPGETAYLNEAKQIIDRARLKQKEDFEPFMQRAREKLKNGDYQRGRILCEEMLRSDPSYTEARECVAQATEGMMKGKRMP